MYNFPTEVIGCLWTTTMALWLQQFLMVRTHIRDVNTQSIKLCTASVTALYFAVLCYKTAVVQRWVTKISWHLVSTLTFHKKNSRFANNNNNAGCTCSTGVPGFYRLITPRLPQKLSSLVSRCNSSILLSTCVAAFHKRQTYKLDYLRYGDVQTVS